MLFSAQRTDLFSVFPWRFVSLESSLCWFLAVSTDHYMKFNVWEYYTTFPLEDILFNINIVDMKF